MTALRHKHKLKVKLTPVVKTFSTHNPFYLLVFFDYIAYISLSVVLGPVYPFSISVSTPELHVSLKVKTADSFLTLETVVD